jgi:hypothetical protein
VKWPFSKVFGLFIIIGIYLLYMGLSFLEWKCIETISDQFKGHHFVRCFHQRQLATVLVILAVRPYRHHQPLINKSE